MPGDYLYPRELPENTSVLGVNETNELLMPVVDRLHAQCNQHNISSGISNDIILRKGSRLKISKAENWTTCLMKDWDASGGLGAYPAAADYDFEVLDSPQWQAMLTLTETTGQESITIYAQFEYTHLPWPWSQDASGYVFVEDILARVVFALRVDGRVYSPTDFNEGLSGSPVPLQLANFDSLETTGISPAPFFTVQRPISGLNYQHTTIALTATVNVTPGDHTFELLVKRTQDKVSRKRRIEADKTRVGNRSMFLLRSPHHDTLKAVKQSLTIPSWSDRDVVDNASLVVDRLEVVESAMDAGLTPGCAAAGSLVNAHLPSMLHDSDAVVNAVSGYTTINNRYPGGASSTVVGTPTGTGWYRVPGMATKDFNTESTDEKNLSAFLLLADIGHGRVAEHDLTIADFFDSAFGKYIIGYSVDQGLNWTMDQRIRASIHQSIMDFSKWLDTNLDPAPLVNINIPFRFVIDLQDADFSNYANRANLRFALFVSCMHAEHYTTKGHSSVDFGMSYYEGHMTVLQLKAR